MKSETYFKKAMQIKDPNLRLARLEHLCFMFIPHSEYWIKALEESHKLRDLGFKYW